MQNGCLTDSAVYGQGCDTGHNQVGAASLSFWGVLRLLVVFLGFPAGVPWPPLSKKKYKLSGSHNRILDFSFDGGTKNVTNWH